MISEKYRCLIIYYGYFEVFCIFGNLKDFIIGKDFLIVKLKRFVNEK